MDNNFTRQDKFTRDAFKLNEEIYRDLIIEAYNLDKIIDIKNANETEDSSFKVDYWVYAIKNATRIKLGLQVKQKKIYYGDFEYKDLYYNSFKPRTYSIRAQKQDTIKTMIKEGVITADSIPRNDKYYSKSEFFTDIIDCYLYAIVNEEGAVIKATLIDWKEIVSLRDDGLIALAKKEYKVPTMDEDTIYYPEDTFKYDGNRIVSIPLFENGPYGKYSLEKNFPNTILSSYGYID